MAADPYFVLALVSTGGAVLVLCIKVCFASKCDSVQLGWGFITIHRDVDIEASRIETPNMH